MPVPRGLLTQAQHCQEFLDLLQVGLRLHPPQPPPGSPSAELDVGDNDFQGAPPPPNSPVSSLYSNVRTLTDSPLSSLNSNVRTLTDGPLLCVLQHAHVDGKPDVLGLLFYGPLRPVHAPQYTPIRTLTPSTQSTLYSGVRTLTPASRGSSEHCGQGQTHGGGRFQVERRGNFFSAGRHRTSHDSTHGVGHSTAVCCRRLAQAGAVAQGSERGHAGLQGAVGARRLYIVFVLC